MRWIPVISYHVYKYGVYIIYCIYIYAYAYMYVYMYVYVYVSFEKYECEPTNFDIQVPMVGIWCYDVIQERVGNPPSTCAPARVQMKYMVRWKDSNAWETRTHLCSGWNFSSCWHNLGPLMWGCNVEFWIPCNIRACWLHSLPFFRSSVSTARFHLWAKGRVT